LLNFKEGKRRGEGEKKTALGKKATGEASGEAERGVERPCRGRRSGASDSLGFPRGKRGRGVGQCECHPNKGGGTSPQEVGKKDWKKKEKEEFLMGRDGRKERHKKPLARGC